MRVSFINLTTSFLSLRGLGCELKHRQLSYKTRGEMRPQKDPRKSAKGIQKIAMMSHWGKGQGDGGVGKALSGSLNSSRNGVPGSMGGKQQESRVRGIWVQIHN